MSAPNIEYRNVKWFAGLGEHMTITKTARTIRTERADGTPIDYAALLHGNRNAWRARHGAATKMLADRLEIAQPNEMIPVALRYELPGLSALVRQPREQRIKGVKAAIAAAVEPLSAWLRGHGFVESGRSQWMPALFGALPARALAEVVHDARVMRVALDEAIEPLGSGEFAALDPIVEHAIDTTWNTCATCGSGNYGVEVGVGMIEWCGHDADVGGRSLYDEHVAFSHLTPFSMSSDIGYTEPPTECNDAGDCESEEGGCDNSGSKPKVACLDGRCVSLHASQVASVISASTSTDPTGAHGAAKVQLYMANNAKPNTISGYVLAYSAVVEADSKIVNETHEGLTFGDAFQVADYFTRIYEVQPVQSAGNSPNLQTSLEACPKSANSICVGATTTAGVLDIAFYSAFANPGSAIFEPTDREEPDVTAYGGETDGSPPVGDDVRVMGFSSSSDWSGNNEGTSFSAPVISNLLAHMLADCPGLNVHHPLVMRAVVRTAAWAGNPDAHAYSIPNDPTGTPNFDWKDGAGWVNATSLDWFCLGPGSNGGAGVINVDLEGGEDPQGGDSSYVPGQEIGNEPENYTPQDYTPPHSSSFARKEYELAVATLEKDDRVRATITWFVCPEDAVGETPAEVDVDLDLFLYHEESDTYIYGSQSVSDNNEGFDIQVPVGGTYKLLYTRPAGTTESCGTQFIPMGWAARWGTPW